MRLAWCKCTGIANLVLPPVHLHWPHSHLALAPPPLCPSKQQWQKWLQVRWAVPPHPYHPLLQIPERGGRDLLWRAGQHCNPREQFYLESYVILFSSLPCKFHPLLSKRGKNHDSCFINLPIVNGVRGMEMKWALNFMSCCYRKITVAIFLKFSKLHSLGRNDESTLDQGGLFPKVLDHDLNQILWSVYTPNIHAKFHLPCEE